MILNSNFKLVQLSKVSFQQVIEAEGQLIAIGKPIKLFGLTDEFKPKFEGNVQVCQVWDNVAIEVNSWNKPAEKNQEYSETVYQLSVTKAEPTTLEYRRRVGNKLKASLLGESIPVNATVPKVKTDAKVSLKKKAKQKA